MKRNIFKLIFLFLFFAFANRAAAQMQITFTVSDFNGSSVSCFGSQNGSVTVSVTGGNPPYTYLWSNDATTATITELGADYYSVTVTDSDSVQVTAGVNLTAPKPIELTLEASKYTNGFNVSCYSCYNGSITTTILGGTSPYTYQWNDNQSTTQNRSSIKGGVYDLIVTDANSCLMAREITLTEPERTDWTVNGNTGSVDGNFVGTTDSADLVFKTNGEERIRIAGSGNMQVSSLSGTGEKMLSVDASGNLIRSGMSIGFLPAQGVLPDIFNYGKAAQPGTTVTYCNGPYPNTLHQFDGMLESYHNDATYGYNVLRMGTDTEHGIIDADGLGGSGGNSALLLNYYCGNDVVAGNGTSGDLIAAHNFIVNGTSKLSGNVGIGTASTSSLLSVGSTAQFQINNTGAITAATGITSSGAVTFSSLGNGLLKSTGGVLSLANGGTDYQTPISAGTYQDPITAGTGLSLNGNTINSVWTASSGNISNNNSGNVGIGTSSSPDEKLEVVGNIKVSGNILASGANSILTSHDLHILNKVEVGNSIWLGGSTIGTTDNIYTDNADLVINGDPSYNYNTIINTNNGRVGIGTTDPKDKFQVNSDQYKVSIGSIPDYANTSLGMSYLGFNMVKNQSSNQWTVEGNPNTGNNGGCAIMADIAGGIRFINKKTSYSNSTETFLDSDIPAKTSLYINSDGKVIIGGGLSTPGNYDLYVANGILTERVKVAISTSGDWSDKVFSKEYDLKPLKELQDFYSKFQHLPDIPSAKEVVESGIDLGQMDAKLLQKIEELTLYIVDQQKQIDEMKKQLNSNKK